MFLKTKDDCVIASFDTDDLIRDSKDVYLCCNIEEAKLLKILRQRFILRKNFNITFD